MSEVKFGVSQISNPTPKIWKRISDSLKYFSVGAIGLMSGIDMIPHNTSKWIILALSGFILLLKSIDMGLGVEDLKPTATDNTN